MHHKVPGRPGHELPWRSEGGSAAPSCVEQPTRTSAVAPAAAAPAAPRVPAGSSCAQCIKHRAVHVRRGRPPGLAASPRRALDGARPSLQAKKAFLDWANASGRRVSPWALPAVQRRSASWRLRLSWGGAGGLLAGPLLYSVTLAFRTPCVHCTAGCCWFGQAIAPRCFAPSSGFGKRCCGLVPPLRLGPALWHRSL